MEKIFEIIKYEEHEIEFRGTVAAFNAVIKKTKEIINDTMEESGLPEESFYFTNPTVTYDMSEPNDVKIYFSLYQIIFPKYGEKKRTNQ